MLNLQLLAFRSDITRVFSLIVARELSSVLTARSVCPATLT